MGKRKRKSYSEGEHKKLKNNESMSPIALSNEQPEQHAAIELIQYRNELLKRVKELQEIQSSSNLMGFKGKGKGNNKKIKKSEKC